jgi:hypothetical protein
MTPEPKPLEQQTQPKKGEPITIPVPKRADVMRVLKKAAQPLTGSKKS